MEIQLQLQAALLKTETWRAARLTTLHLHKLFMPQKYMHNVT